MQILRSPIVIVARAEAVATVAKAASLKIAALLNTPPLCNRKKNRKIRGAWIAGARPRAAGGAGSPVLMAARAEAAATDAEAAMRTLPPLCKRKKNRNNRGAGSPILIAARAEASAAVAAAAIIRVAALLNT